MVSVEPVAAARLRPLLALVEMRTQVAVVAVADVTIMMPMLHLWVVLACWLAEAAVEVVLLTQATTSKQEELEVHRIAPTLAAVVHPGVLTVRMAVLVPILTCLGAAAVAVAVHTKTERAARAARAECRAAVVVAVAAAHQPEGSVEPVEKGFVVYGSSKLGNDPLDNERERGMEATASHFG
jgi:hypothetical protein